MQSTILVILPWWAVFSLSLSLRRFCLYQHVISQRTVNKTSWSNPRQTRICYIFQLWAVIKALLKKISQYLLSHFRIRIIVLTCPDINKPARNHQPKSCVPARSHKLQLRGQYYFNWNLRPHFSLSLFVWRLESTTTKSLLRHLHCRGFPLFKSRQSKLCSKWRNNMDAFVALQLSRCIPTNR